MTTKSKIYRPPSREAWLAERPKFIGGSEIASILGCNPYQSAYSLWELKTGKAPKFEGNDSTHFGDLLEGSVATEFENRTGMRVIKTSEEDVIYQHPEYDFLRGTPDRFYTHEPSRAGRVSEDHKRVLECKTTMRSLDAEDVPTYWYTQVQFYMGLTNKQKGAIAWLQANFGFKFGYLEVDFDASIFNQMVEVAVEFWEYNVLKDIPPEPQSWEDVERRFGIHSIGKIHEVGSVIKDVHADLKDLKIKKKVIEEQIGECENTLKMQFDDAEALSYDEKIICTWKAPKASNKFNADKFKNDHEKLHAKYCEEKQGGRRFLVKG